MAKGEQPADPVKKPGELAHGIQRQKGVPQVHKESSPPEADVSTEGAAQQPLPSSDAGSVPQGQGTVPAKPASPQPQTPVPKPEATNPKP